MDMVGNWVAWPALDDGAGITRAFVMGYKFTDDSTELWSGRFCNLKDKKKDAIAGAIVLLRKTVPTLISTLGIDVKHLAFIPAPSSKDTIASKSGVTSILARHCAESCGATFILDAVSKNAHDPIHGKGNAGARTEELDKANYVGVELEHCSTVIIVDDFITRGGTMSRIARAMLKATPKLTVYGLALGKTERLSYWRGFGVEKNNDHIPSICDTLWKEGEALYRAKLDGEKK